MVSRKDFHSCSQVAVVAVALVEEVSANGGPVICVAVEDGIIQDFFGSAVGMAGVAF